MDLSSLNPFHRVPDDIASARSEFEALELANNQRVARFKQYRKEGEKVRDPNIEVNTEDLSDYGRRPKNDGQPRRHHIPIPFGKAMTVKHAYRISGQLPDAVVDERDSTALERHRSDTMEKIAWAIIRHSRGETTFADGAWHGSEVGSACFDIYWSVKDQIPCIRALDPVGIFEVQGVNDPHDFQRVYRTWDVPLASLQAEYRDQLFREAPIDVYSIKSTHTDGGVDMARIVNMCDRNVSLRFALSGQGGAVGLQEYTHNYGFVPYIIIPNIGPYDDVWGWADYEFVRALTQYLPMLFSREADILKAVAGGAYQDNGSGVASATVAKIIREGGVLNTKRESEVKPIETAKMPDFADSHRAMGMEALKMVGFVPDAAWGLGTAGSGTDRGLQLQPLAEYTAMKQLNWATGMGRLFGMAFQMIEAKMVTTMKYRGTKPGAGRSTQSKMPFIITIGPKAAPSQATLDSQDPMDPAEVVDLPNTPKELFDGDYSIRFNWRMRVDPDDPQYVMSEVNKFTSGLQSMRTTLENLGVQAPEDEMKRLEDEAKRFPWVNQGLVSMIMAQMRGNAQGTGGGAPTDMPGAVSGAMETMLAAGGGGESGALNADAATAAAGGTGSLYGAA